LQVIRELRGAEHETSALDPRNLPEAHFPGPTECRIIRITKPDG